jgi:uncharacterized peroxidase-related enzyme
MMARINPVAKNVDSRTQRTLESVEKKLGKVPNLISTLANSPAAVQAYLGYSQALAGGSLSPATREQIALAVSEANQCDYCLSAHTYLGSQAGLSESDLLDARHGTAADERTNAALVFARKVVDDRGHVSDEDVEQLRQAGYNDGQIAEIVANVVLTIFTNYFNHVAGTEVDFPAVPVLMAV